MANALYGAMNAGKNPQNIFQAVQQFRQNPAAFLQRSGFKIPANLNDPNAIIQHLMNSGQVSQQKYEQARRLVDSMRR